MTNINNINEGVNKEELISLLSDDICLNEENISFFYKLKQKLMQKKKEKLLKNNDILQNIISNNEK